MLLQKLSMRIFSNPIEIDSNTLVYCFSHNLSMLDNMIYSLQIYNIKKIHIIKNQHAISGVPNYEDVVNKYKLFAIETELIPFDYDIIQTKHESDAVIKYALEHKYKRIILVAPIFHILRGTMTMISSAIENMANIKFCSIINQTLNWNALCSTHQGNTYTTLSNTLDLELERIANYIEKGDIKKCDEIWQYLDRVNSIKMFASDYKLYN